MDKYKMTIAGVERELNMFPVNDKLDIAAFIMFGDVEVTEKAAAELLKICPEHDVVVSAEETVVRLADWQMYMCYSPPGGWGSTVTEYKTHSAVEILMGEYNPAFKLHFYLISVILMFARLSSSRFMEEQIRVSSFGKNDI